MSGIGKKAITQTTDRTARAALESLSKAALADLVVDLLRRNEGEALDGEPLVVALREAFAPIAAIRGDALPAPKVGAP